MKVLKVKCYNTYWRFDRILFNGFNFNSIFLEQFLFKLLPLCKCFWTFVTIFVQFQDRIMDMSIIVIFIRFGENFFISLIFNIFIMDDNWVTILIWILVILLRKKKDIANTDFRFFFRYILVNVLHAFSIPLNARGIYLQESGIRLLIISMIRSRYRSSLVFQSRHLSLAYFGLKARFG